jgi:hypothetical protein
MKATHRGLVLLHPPPTPHHPGTESGCWRVPRTSTERQHLSPRRTCQQGIGWLSDDLLSLVSGSPTTTASPAGGGGAAGRETVGAPPARWNRAFSHFAGGLTTCVATPSRKLSHKPPGSWWLGNYHQDERARAAEEIPPGAQAFSSSDTAVMCWPQAGVIDNLHPGLPTRGLDFYIAVAATTLLKNSNAPIARLHVKQSLAAEAPHLFPHVYQLLHMRCAQSERRLLRVLIWRLVDRFRCTGRSIAQSECQTAGASWPPLLRVRVTYSAAITPASSSSFRYLRTAVRAISFADSFPGRPSSFCLRVRASAALLKRSRSDSGIRTVIAGNFDGKCTPPSAP